GAVGGVWAMAMLPRPIRAKKPKTSRDLVMLSSTRPSLWAYSAATLAALGPPRQWDKRESAVLRAARGPGSAASPRGCAAPSQASRDAIGWTGTEKARPALEGESAWRLP